MWNTNATEGWNEPNLRAERFQRIGSSNVAALWKLLAASNLANEIGIERIDRRHRELSDYILSQTIKRGGRVVDVS
jgi:isopenicillin-N epimerase